MMVRAHAVCSWRCWIASWLAALLLVAGAGRVRGSSATSARLDFMSGVAYFHQGEYRSAFKAFVEALRKDPSMPGPHYYLGRIFEKQKRYEDAVKQYRETLMLDPDHRGAKAGLRRLAFYVPFTGVSGARGGGAVGGKAGEDERRKLYEKELRNIEQLIKGGRLDAAAEEIKRLEGVVGENAELRLLAGRLAEKRGDYVTALHEYERAVRLDSSPETLYRLAVASYRIGDYDRADEAADEILKKKPDHWRAMYLKSLTCRRKGRLEESFRWLRKASRLAPDEPAIHKQMDELGGRLAVYYYNSGMFNFTQGNWKQAVRDLQRAIEHGLAPDQRVLAEQYLLIARLSMQKVDEQLRRLKEERRREQLSFVRKRLTFEEVQRTPKVWEKGAYVEFVGTLVHVADGRRTLVVDTAEGNDYRSDSVMRSWFKVVLPEPLPEDPRVRDGSKVRVEGKLQEPEYLKNIYNNLYSEEPQPVVLATYIEISNEAELAGPLKLDYLSLSRLKKKVGRYGGSGPR